VSKLRIENLTKRYGSTLAINGVSLDIRDHEFLVLLGPSGCGKTSTLRCIAGLETPDEGTIFVDEMDVTDLPTRDRDVAMVFQSYALYPHMTIYENLAFPLRTRHMTKDDIASRIKEVGELLRIADLLQRKPKQLSGGEAQRVALGRAIIREPKAFLMDEPLSNLDAILRLYMRAELKKLQKELGTTTIYVTHDQAEALTMAERVAIMNHGALQQVADPKTIYERPSTRFVAGFIGNPPMNLLDCEVVSQDDDHAMLEFSDFKCKVPLHGMDDTKSIDGKKVFGIRPEHIIVSKTQNSGVQGEIYVVEPLGSEVIIDVKVGNSIMKVKSVQFEGSPGEKLWLEFPEKKIHLFDVSAQ